MEEEMGKGLQIKSQDELIDEEGLYRKRIGLNKFKVPIPSKSEDKFVDARSDPISTIPRTQEEHEELDKLNEYFSERLYVVNKKTSLPTEKKEEGKTVEGKDEINTNKKRVVTTQGQREDSDNE